MAASPQSQQGTFRLDAPISRVFPMFTPLGERAWAKGWNPQMLSGETERGTVFRTSGAGGVESVWIVTRYEPALHAAGYARIAQGVSMGLVDVACAPAGDDATDVTVRYTLTALADDAESTVREFLSPPRYAAFMDEWRTAIAAALAHG